MLEPFEQKAKLVGDSVLVALTSALQSSTVTVPPSVGTEAKQPSRNVMATWTPLVAHATHMLDPPMVFHERHVAAAAVVCETAIKPSTASTPITTFLPMTSPFFSAQRAKRVRCPPM